MSNFCFLNKYSSTTCLKVIPVSPNSVLSHQLQAQQFLFDDYINIGLFFPFFSFVDMKIILIKTF